MAELPTECSRLRPAFGRIIEKWPGLSVTVEHQNVVTIKRENPTVTGECRALLVVGRNRLDPRLFERCAAGYIERFLDAGWSVELLDFDFLPMSSTGEATASLPPGVVVAQTLAQSKRLHYLMFFTHSRHAINLSEVGEDLIVDQPSNGPRSFFNVLIKQLRLSESASQEGWVDVFGCFCRQEARWPQELAKALNWPVRTVYPGYGIYFPEETHEPRSAIPLTRRLLGSRYAKRGWAVWLPGSARPVRVSEPGETACRYSDRYGRFERFFTRMISVGLEPVRDFRKKRLFAKHAQRDGVLASCVPDSHELVPGS